MTRTSNHVPGNKRHRKAKIKPRNISTASNSMCASMTWWRHQMETFSVLLAICAGNRSPVNYPHKGQWRGALMFSLICVWINGWVNNREAGDLRRYRSHYDVTVMKWWSPSPLRGKNMFTVFPHWYLRYIIVSLLVIWWYHSNARLINQNVRYVQKCVKIWSYHSLSHVCLWVWLRL